MDKTEARVVIKYLQKKSMVANKIHEDMVQILSEDSPSYALVNKWAAKFKQNKCGLTLSFSNNWKGSDFSSLIVPFGCLCQWMAWLIYLSAHLFLIQTADIDH